MKTTYRVLYMIGFIFNIFCLFYISIAMILVKAVPDTLIADGVANTIDELNQVFYIFLVMVILQGMLVVVHVFLLFIKKEKPIYPLPILALVFSLLNINLFTIIGSIFNTILIHTESKASKTKKL